MLGIGEEGLAVHQLNDHLAIPEGIQNIGVVLCLIIGQLQLIGHILQPLNVVVALGAKVAGQLVRVILMARHIGSQRGHADHAAAVIQNGAGGIHDTAILLQRVIRKERTVVVLLDVGTVLITVGDILSQDHILFFLGLLRKRLLFGGLCLLGFLRLLGLLRKGLFLLRV